MEKLNDILFYSLEKAIKSYRQYAQRVMMQNGYDLTIDQWLIIKAISDYPDYNQQEIAEVAFKDFASVTRMIELLVKKDYLTRTTHPTDRRRFKLKLTDKAVQNLLAMQPLTVRNRKIALDGIPTDQIVLLQQLLVKITENCQSTT